MTRMAVIFLIAGVSAYILTVGASSNQASLDAVGEEDRMNVVLISMDTTRADHLGTYGYEKNTTPHIDTLANNSLIFQNAYTSIPYTPAAHATMFTSLPPRVHNLTVPLSLLTPEIDTLPEVLKNNGYTTGGVVSSINAGTPYNLQQGITPFFNPGQPAQRVSRTGKRLLSDMADDQPFFLFLHFFDPHQPYDNENYTRFLDNVDGRSSSKIYQDLNAQENLSEAELAVARANYDAEIHSVDTAIGNIITQLKQQNQYNNTIIIITADHGELLGEYDLPNPFGHVRRFEKAVMHVPLIIHIPNTPPQTIQRQVGLIDLPTTILPLLNIQPPTYYEGINMLEESNPTIVIESFRDGPLKQGVIRRNTGFRQERDGQHTVLWGDREASPSEKHDITTFLQQWQDEKDQKRDRLLADTDTRSPLDSPAVKERLRELGYLP